MGGPIDPTPISQKQDPASEAQKMMDKSQQNERLQLAYDAEAKLDAQLGVLQALGKGHEVTYDHKSETFKAHGTWIDTFKANHYWLGMLLVSPTTIWRFFTGRSAFHTLEQMKSYQDDFEKTMKIAEGVLTNPQIDRASRERVAAKFVLIKDEAAKAVPGLAKIRETVAYALSDEVQQKYADSATDDEMDEILQKGVSYFGAQRRKAIEMARAHLVGTADKPGEIAKVQELWATQLPAVIESIQQKLAEERVMGESPAVPPLVRAEGHMNLMSAIRGASQADLTKVSAPETTERSVESGNPLRDVLVGAVEQRRGDLNPDNDSVDEDGDDDDGWLDG